MKYYQCKKQRRYMYPLFVIYTIVAGALAIMALFDVGFISGGRLERIIAGLFFLLLTLAGIAMFIYLTKYIFGNYKSTVEFTEEGITYQGEKRQVRIKWKDVTMVYLFPNDFDISIKRIVYFMTLGTSPNKLILKATEKMIWSEYNDEMLEEIKKYWHGRIVNEDKYLKYKNKRDKKLRK